MISSEFRSLDNAMFRPRPNATTLSSSSEIIPGKTVLLFLDEQRRDWFFKGDRHLRSTARYLLRTLGQRRRIAGYDSSFARLVLGLHVGGYDVRVNDYDTARSNPQYPVGLGGWPTILDGWDLPNPAILGPGLFSHPLQAPGLMEDTRFKRYIIRSDWQFKRNYPFYGDACFFWYSGIDTGMWTDASMHDKSCDFLVYDKIRFDEKRVRPIILKGIVEALKGHGLSYRVLRYGKHPQKHFYNALRETRAMVFLCEHENQGAAVLEAMSCNVPILAWDQGLWMDPARYLFQDPMIPASSVLPWFTNECGERFRSLGDFAEVLQTFLSRLTQYRPRAYVKQNVSLEGCGKLYADEYFKLATYHSN